jgi:hypothetical protein
MLARRAVHVTLIRHIGKESNRLEEVEEGLIGDLDEVQIQYADPHAEWEAIVPMLREIGVSELARRTKISERTLRSNLNSGRVPHPKARHILMLVAAPHRRTRQDPLPQ